MDKRRRYGRKIKKTKNLYRKKKTAGQKVFGTVIFILAVSAIAFIGFCIGKPLLDHLNGIGKEPETQWTPQASYEQRQQTDQPAESTPSGESGSTAPLETAPEDTAPFSHTASPADMPQASGSENHNDGLTETQPLLPETTAITTAAPELVPAGSGTVIAAELPSGALANRSSLSAVLAKAKAAGYNSAVIQLKDKSGYFKYHSNIEGVEDAELIAGSMTLDDITEVFRENGITPIAEIAVLSDNAGCKAFTDMSYKCKGETISWLDGYDGKRWANPENAATREYFAKITTEIAAAGINDILLTDVVFPAFHSNDTTWIEQKYFSDDRYKLLYNVIKSGNIIEMRASDVVTEELGRTAEVLKDLSQLHNNRIALVISRSDLPSGSEFPADAGRLAETILSLASKKTGSLEIIPVIESSGFDDTERAKIISTLRNLGYQSCIVR